MAGDLNGHVERSSNGYECFHGGFGYGSSDQKGERIFELGAPIDMCVCNAFFKKKDNRLVTYVSGTFRSQFDYIMVKRKDRKFVEDVKVVPGERLCNSINCYCVTY